MEDIIHGEGDGEVVTTIPTLHGTMEVGDFGQMDHKLKM
jgi:hypothetical protein